MPAFNGERYIADSIISVINQTHENWELVVIDDGSVDRTREIVLNLREKESRIRYFHQPNGGQGMARNTGIRLSQGDLIAFLDQDDLWLAEKLGLQIKAMLESGADVVFSDSYIFHDSKTLDQSMSFLTITGRFTGLEMLDLLFTQNRIPVLTALVKKNLIEDVGYIDQDEAIRNCDDYDLWMKLAERGATFFGLPDNLARYRIHPTQASKNEIKSLMAELAVLERYCSKVKVSDREKRRRFREIYQKLAASLAEENAIDEARKYLFSQLSRDGFGLMTLFQLLILRIAPGRYNNLNALLRRIQASAAYRIDRLNNNFRQMLSQ